MGVTILDAEGECNHASYKTNHTNTSFFNNHVTKKKKAIGAQGNELRVSFSNTVHTQEMLPINPDY